MSLLLFVHEKSSFKDYLGKLFDSMYICWSSDLALELHLEFI